MAQSLRSLSAALPTEVAIADAQSAYDAASEACVGIRAAWLGGSPTDAEQALLDAQVAARKVLEAAWAAHAEESAKLV